MDDDLARKIAALRDEKKYQETQKQGYLKEQLSRIAQPRAEYRNMLRGIETKLNALSKNHFPEIKLIMTTNTGGRRGGQYEMHLGHFSSRKDISAGFCMSIVIVALVNRSNTNIIRVQDNWTIGQWERSYGDWGWSTLPDVPIEKIIQTYSDNGLSDLAVEHQLQCFEGAKALLNEDSFAQMIHVWLGHHQRVIDWHKNRPR